MNINNKITRWNNYHPVWQKKIYDRVKNKNIVFKIDDITIDVKNIDIKQLVELGIIDIDDRHEDENSEMLDLSLYKLAICGLIDTIEEIINKLAEKGFEPKNEKEKFYFAYFIDKNIEKAKEIIIKRYINFKTFDLEPAVLMYRFFGDIKRAYGLLHFEKSDNMEIDWIDLAKIWGLVLEKHETARKILTTSEKNLDMTNLDNYCPGYIGYHTNNYIKIAVGWADIFDDTDSAKRCLNKSGLFDLEWSCFLECAEIYMSYLNDKKNAKKFLLKAEQKASYPDDLIGVAEDWLFLLEDKNRAQKCFKLGERCIAAWEENDPYWWRMYAEWYLKVLTDRENSERCLKNAEKNADSEEDFKKCGDLWIEIFSNDSNAKRCYEKAEKIKKPWYLMI